MIVTCYGITKSGSTLAFELACKALANVGHPQTRLADELVDAGHNINFLSELPVHRLQNLITAVDDGSIVAFKTHGGLGQPAFRLATDLCSRGLLRVQVVWRDPRDVCLSLVDAGAQARAANRDSFSEIVTLEEAATEVCKQLANLRKWASMPGALILSYDEVAFDTDRALQAIDTHLGIRSDHEAVIDEVFNRTFTQKNKGVKNRYTTELDDEQLMMLETRFSKFIKTVCVERDYSWFKLGHSQSIESA
jgi:Sulfotransferase domain